MCLNVCVCVCVYVYVVDECLHMSASETTWCTYLYECVFVNMYVRDDVVYVFVCMCVYVCVCVCVCVCVHM